MPLKLWNRTSFCRDIHLISVALEADQEQLQDIDCIYISDRGEGGNWFYVMRFKKLKMNGL